MACMLAVSFLQLGEMCFYAPLSLKYLLMIYRGYQCRIYMALVLNLLLTNVLLELISVREGVFSLPAFDVTAIQQLIELICVN